LSYYVNTLSLVNDKIDKLLDKIEKERRSVKTYKERIIQIKEEEDINKES